MGIKGSGNGGPGPTDRGRAVQWVLAVSLITGLALLLAFRSGLVLVYLAKDSVPPDAPLWTVFWSDAGYFAAVIALMIVARASKSVPLLAAVLRLTVVVLLTAYCVDVLVFDMFSVRLDMYDMMRYGKEGLSGKTIFDVAIDTSGDSMSISSRAVPILLCLFVFSLLYLVFDIRAHRGDLVALTVVVAVLIGVRMYGAEPYSLKSWVYRNFAEINLTDVSRRPYSEAFARRLRQEYQPVEICQAGRTERPHVILLIMESLSSYHSRYFSGLLDWTPNLDRIAADGFSLTNFHANGFTTEHGLISILTGEYFIPGTQEYSYRYLGDVGNSFSRYNDVDSVAEVMDRATYRTVFLTSGDLSFSDKRPWLHNIGFEEIYGHELPDYQGWPRSHFGAAPDEALYGAALRLISEHDGDRPLFLSIETVNGHRPLFSPDGPPHTEERVFRYVDEHMGRFYDALNATGFLENNLLIIVGDHRSMTPVTADEIAVLGESAPARVPALVLGRGVIAGTASDLLFQQTDIRSSLSAMVSTEHCRREFDGDFLDKPPRASRCVFHALGGRRELVYTRCGEAEGYISLGGDATSVIGDPLPDADRIIDMINYHRIVRETG